MIKTINGPKGLRIELDSSEIFPDDPGQGTPAIVYYEGYYASFDCALNSGELDCGSYILTANQMKWLEDKIDNVNEFLEKNQ